jgi:hypothetical protein
MGMNYRQFKLGPISILVWDLYFRDARFLDGHDTAIEVCFLNRLIWCNY